ncbi:hypothetical protein B0H13DRAFT_1903818, partial [Mycena leptocephala]
DVEKTQDFLRDNGPDNIDAKKAFEFHHRDIDNERKIDIQRRIENGELRGVPATDALGLGMDFRTIMRVFLWMKPRTFLSLIQKIGHCVRDPNRRGEAVLFITKAMYTQCCAELEILHAEHEAAQEDAALELQDESDDEEEGPAVTVKRRRRGKGKQKPLSAMELRDKQYFWNTLPPINAAALCGINSLGIRINTLIDIFTEHLAYPVLAGPCCDNCNPEVFEVETIALVGGIQLKARRKVTSSPELEDAMRKKLNEVCEQIMASDYPNQHFLTGTVILADNVVDALAKRARLVTSVDTLLQQTRWIHASRYGDRVVQAIQETVAKFPDLAKLTRETQAAEKQQKMVDAAAFKELRSHSVKVFDGSYDAVYSEMETSSEEPPSARKRKKIQESPADYVIFS